MNRNSDTKKVQWYELRALLSNNQWAGGPTHSLRVALFMDDVLVRKIPKRCFGGRYGCDGVGAVFSCSLEWLRRREAPHEFRPSKEDGISCKCHNLRGRGLLWGICLEDTFVGSTNALGANEGSEHVQSSWIIKKYL